MAINFEVILSDCSNMALQMKKDEVWYTDRSKSREKAGYGFVNLGLNIEIGGRLSNHASPLQAELIAIEMCAKEIIKTKQTNKILILCDCEAALKSLKMNNSKLREVKSCLATLNKVAEVTRVTLGCTPGHSRTEGNDKADEAAKIGSTIEESFCIKVSKSPPVKAKLLENWTIEEHKKRWLIDGPKLKHSFQMITLGNDKRINQIRNFNRADIRLVIGSLTGHACHYNLLKKIGVVTDDSCRFCKTNEKKTMQHVFTTCRSFDKDRLREFGEKRITLDHLSRMELKSIIKFIKNTSVMEIFDTRHNV